METDRFDALTRGLLAASSRRGLALLLVGAALIRPRNDPSIFCGNEESAPCVRSTVF
jgi:hypothetical protein